MGRNLSFNLRDKLKVDREEYSVIGIIEYLNNSDGYAWTEYKLKKMSDSSIRWLSVDSGYEEYAIYRVSKKRYTDDNIKSMGYRETDFGEARVSACNGEVDVDLGDKVKYREFEDLSEENIIAIEEWEDETEYSTGYYLDEDEIEKIYSSGYNNRETQYNNYKPTNSKINNNSVNGIAIAVIAFLVIIGIALFNSKASKNNMSKYISESSNFTYTTSVTSDLNNKEKADVYTTPLTVELAAKDIIDGIEGDTEDIQENTEDGSVAIITSDEYGLVYSTEEGETLVQISSRLYAYSSTNDPYRSRYSTARYFRNYYYSRCYSSDYSKYKKYTSGYENYDGGYVDTNYNDTYRNYSDSVRQSSVNSRSSSGGGTSSGK